MKIRNIDNMVETRKDICRYGNENKIIKEYAQFGWTFESKRLLNRFGNPLPSDARVSEDDLKEKCSYELYFKRQIHESKVIELTNLQNEYDSIRLLDESYGGGRVTGSVFISIASIACFFASAFSVAQSAKIALAIIGLFVGSPIIVIFITGCSRKARASNKNVKLRKQKQVIADKAQEVLKRPL